MVQYRLATRSCLRTTSSTRPPDENGPNTNFGGEQKLNSKRRQLNCNAPRECSVSRLNMKVKGLSVVEVARALLASAKSRWVGGSASKMQGVILQKKLLPIPENERKSRSGEEAGRGKQGAGGTQEGLKEVSPSYFANCQISI